MINISILNVPLVTNMSVETKEIRGRSFISLHFKMGVLLQSDAESKPENIFVNID